ncbi:MAG: hypothetical protein NT094_04955 [Candidatus Staskawiczbacteria bacterium]|nr:hypothetical protein [Candidatus Staskawiczbacteria bacterium]
MTTKKIEDKVIERIKTNKSAIVSLCFGIASVIFWEFSIVPIIAIIFGIIGLARDEKRLLAGIGLILGIIFLILRISHGPIDRGFSLDYFLNKNSAQTATTLQSQNNDRENKISVNKIGSNYSLKIPSNYPSTCVWGFKEGNGAVAYTNETKSDTNNIHITINRRLSEQAFGYSVACVDSLGTKYIGQFTDENLDDEVAQKTKEYKASALNLELNTNLSENDLSYLNKLVGKSTYDVKFFENSIIRNRLIKLMGSQFSVLETYWSGPSAPIKVENGIFVASACMAHNCSDTSFLIVINIPKNIFYVITKIDGYKTYYYEENKNIPTQVTEWDKDN